MKKPDYILIAIGTALLIAIVLVLCWPHHCTASAETAVLNKLIYLTGESEEITEPEPDTLGTFRVTVYTPYDDGGRWGYQTATGATSQHLMTCAVDPEVIPLGTELKIVGDGMSVTVKAVDTGSAVKGKRVDLFFDGTVEEALDWAELFGDYGVVYVEK